MKNRIWIGTLAVAAMVMMTGCGGGNRTADQNGAEAAADETENTENVENTENSEEESAYSALGSTLSLEDLDPAYQAIVQDYRSMITDNWDWEKIYEDNYSTTIRNMGGTIDQVGYTLYDLDGDGQEELLIGETDTELPQNRIIFDAYMLENGQAKQLFVSQERSLYYLVEEEDGVVLIANEGSNGAANSGWCYYTVENGDLVVQQMVLYDAMTDEQNPWFLAYDDSWDTSTAEHIDEKKGQGIIDSYTGSYAKLPWTPLGQ